MLCPVASVLPEERVLHTPKGLLGGVWNGPCFRESYVCTLGRAVLTVSPYSSIAGWVREGSWWEGNERAQ